MQAMNKKDSMYIQLLQLLVASAAAAFLIFLVFNCVGDYLIDRYCYGTDYRGKRDKSYVRKLQQYIDQHGLSSRDGAQLYSWVTAQKVIFLRIYKDGAWIFDTEYYDGPMDEALEDDYPSENENYYSVTFADGEARINIWGAYAYQFYNYFLVAEVIIAFILYLLFVVLGIRKKMNYIRQLSREIELLEGGSLDYQITVEGKDELGVLAMGLDNMRKSFRSLIEREAKMIRENQRVVTEMSHDLRTPVTSIMLYTEILKKGNYDSEKQWKEYVEKIDKKARRMKHLADHLFAYSLVTGETEVELEEPEVLEVLFYDLFSETCSYLEQKGFRVDFQVNWEERRLCVCPDYVTRLMDNITSNIIKYADPEVPVLIRSVYREKSVGFFFENGVNRTGKTTESTWVGIQSMKSMMLKMGGGCNVFQEENRFRLEIFFPAAS